MAHRAGQKAARPLLYWHAAAHHRVSMCFIRVQFFWITDKNKHSWSRCGPSTSAWCSWLSTCNLSPSHVYMHTRVPAKSFIVNTSQTCEMCSVRGRDRKHSAESNDGTLIESLFIWRLCKTKRAGWERRVRGCLKHMPFAFAAAGHQSAITAFI